jgi:hypothetical protein
VENGVSATGIRFERVVGTHSVAQFHFLVVTGTSAIGKIRALREKGAENAMFHMKHRHMLMDNQLEPFRGRGSQERFQLRKI